jgi:hypothetical protein
MDQDWSVRKYKWDQSMRKSNFSKQGIIYSIDESEKHRRNRFQKVEDKCWDLVYHF